MIDGLNLSSDFIEYLMEMCISSGNNTLGSIEKSAVNYYKRGITTIDDIKFDTKSGNQFIRVYLKYLD